MLSSLTSFFYISSVVDILSVHSYKQVLLKNQFIVTTVDDLGPYFYDCIVEIVHPSLNSLNYLFSISPWPHGNNT